MLLRTAPDALARLGAELRDGSALISATNGKTTTAGMIAAALRATGRTPVHNRAGSNMAWGVATALLEQRGDEGLFEVDEAWLPKVNADLQPKLLLLANLFRDQLDRYGELERLADEWVDVVRDAERRSADLVLNADDPLIADLGRDHELARRNGVTYFGIADPSQALGELQHAHDAKHCRRCGHPYRYERAFVGHLGHYTCSNCEADRPEPDVYAESIELLGMEGSRFVVRTPGGRAEISLPLPGLYNVYNAVAAVATALALGVPLERAAQALAGVEAVFGRVETIPVGDRQLSIMLIKNPAGANEVLRTLRQEAEREQGPGLDLWVALNDGIADGRDVSWVWDADFELLYGSVRRITCTGSRGAEMALRLKYAGLPTEMIEVREGIGASLDAALSGAPGRLIALPTYTALLELRTLLTRRGLAKDYWQ
ncbi:MAG TPA: MurT ligase domain-containing protein [Solirubrobacterales bacterium]|nr:MurT ligase domain-containing protein [Solirubrobacterales bacterium]